MSNKITVQCPSCGQSFHAPAAAVGRKARCKACAHVFVIEESGGLLDALAAEPEYISLECACGESLRVKAEYAGMQVQCSGCGQALLVPGGESAVAAQAPARAGGGRSLPWLWIGVAGAAAVVLVVVGVVLMSGGKKGTTVSTSGQRNAQAAQRAETPQADAGTASEDQPDKESAEAAAREPRDEPFADGTEFKRRWQNATAVGRALYKYASAHDDAYPPSWKTLVEGNYLEASVLKAPGDSSDEHYSYALVVGARCDGDQRDVVAYEKSSLYPGRKVYVIYADSHAESATPKQLQVALARSKTHMAARKTKGDAETKLATAREPKNAEPPAKDEEPPSKEAAKAAEPTGHEKPAKSVAKAVSPQELEKRKAEIDALNKTIAEHITAAIEAGKLKEARASIDEVAAKLAAYVERTSTPQWHTSVAPTYQLLDRKRGEYNKKLKATGGDVRDMLVTMPKLPPEMQQSLTALRQELQGVAAMLTRNERMEAAQLIKNAAVGVVGLQAMLDLPPWHETLASLYQLIDKHKGALTTELAAANPDEVTSSEQGLEIGALAPPFEFQSLDDKPVTFKSFEGKWILLEFWATWCGPCRGETPYLKEVYREFGKNQRLVMISLSLDDDVSDAKQYVQKNQMAWIQGFVGRNTPLLQTYGAVAIPAIFLISPEGKVVAKPMGGELIRYAVAKALKAKPAP